MTSGQFYLFVCACVCLAVYFDDTNSLDGGDDHRVGRVVRLQAEVVSNSNIRHFSFHFTTPTRAVFDPFLLWLVAFPLDSRSFEWTAQAHTC